MKPYGKELILDIHKCDVKTFTRNSIKQYLKELCIKIDMKREDLHWWDYEGDPEGYKEAPDHLKGISCVQFITTSNIVIHSLDILKKIYINVFACKEFDPDIVKKFSEDWFGGTTVHEWFIKRY